MNILVACEFSGVVRDAFIEQGHNAVSCDLLPSERPGPHIQADVKTIDLSGYDLMVAHPPCTRLASSAAQWVKERDLYQEQEEALNFVLWLMSAPIARIAIENPVGIIGTRIRPADQIVQPWMFGHGEVKTTCLWFKNLPRLKPTNIVSGRVQRAWLMGTKKGRWMERSRTYEGIARAMAVQWGCLADVPYGIQPDGQLAFL